jgi:hypothetical protein
MVFLWLPIMAGVYAHYEGWSFRDALYFSYITATSIGETLVLERPKPVPCPCSKHIAFAIIAFAIT